MLALHRWSTGSWQRSSAADYRAAGTALQRLLGPAANTELHGQSWCGRFRQNVGRQGHQWSITDDYTLVPMYQSCRNPVCLTANVQADWLKLGQVVTAEVKKEYYRRGLMLEPFFL